MSWSDTEFEALTQAYARRNADAQADLLRRFYKEHGAAETMALAMSAHPNPQTALAWSELLRSWMQRDVASTWPSSTKAAQRWADRASDKQIERVAFFVFSKLPEARRKALIEAVEGAKT